MVVEQTVYLSASAVAGVGRFVLLRFAVFTGPAVVQAEGGAALGKSSVVIAA